MWDVGCGTWDVGCGMWGGVRFWGGGGVWRLAKFFCGEGGRERDGKGGKEGVRIHG